MKQILLFLAYLLPFCASSQMNETFGNPEITENYPWKGDNHKFKIENGFLRLNDMSIQSGAMLYLYGATMEANEWEFRMKSDYRVTNSNLLRVYLWSDNVDLTGRHNAYYVELGKNQGKIALCKVTGRDVVTTLASRDVTNLNDAFDIHVRVVADDNQISLYARSDKKTDYTFIGSSGYTRETVPGYFILYCKYSSLHSKNKYFGPVRIRNFRAGATPQPEEKPDEPAVESFSQVDASTLEMDFKREINPVSASFSLTSLGEVSRIYISEDDKILRLEWDSEMEKGKTYTLSYADLYDVGNNKFIAGSQSFVAVFETKTPESVEPELPRYKQGDLIINEVMANPKGAPGLPETEYVELHNKSGKEIDLKGWSFIYADKGTALTGTVPANAYAVLYRSGRTVQVDEGGISIPLANFPSALANTGKDVALAYGTQIMDELAYPKSDAGYSWERVGDTWKRSSDERGGTPGSANSAEGNNDGADDADDETMAIVMPHEIVFSELLPEPQIGGSEYIELYNRSERALPLTRLAVATRKADGVLNTHYPLSSVTGLLYPGEYALLTKDKEGVINFFMIPDAEALHELKLPVLANTSSQLVLFRSEDEEVIDEVHYSYKWHSPSVKDRKGIALERIDPDGDSQDSNNWTSASAFAGGGTPGYKNSQSGQTGGETPTGLDAPEYNYVTGNYEIYYHVDKAGYMCRASIFDTSGRKAATIANHELPGSEGTFVWDGYATGRNKLAAGVYIFHAELYHPQGSSKSYKKVFLVR